MRFEDLTDDELLARLKRLAASERAAMCDVLACMAEAHRRKAVGKTKYSSLFAYCVGELGMSEETAYRRIRAVRVAQLHPEAYALLRDGLVTVMTLALIEPHLAAHGDLLERIAGKPTRAVETIVAGLAPKPKMEDLIRIVSAPTELLAAPGGEAGERPAPPDSREEAPAPVAWQAEVRFGAGKPFMEAIERLRAALWHKHPGGGLEDILLEAVREFLERRDPARERKRSNARGGGAESRRPPAAIERAVRLRDGQRCSYLAADGRRCEERRGLETDHIVPYALGGASDDPDNLWLPCRAHNQDEARRVFGPRPAPSPGP